MTDPKLYDAIMKLTTRGITRVVLTGEGAGKGTKEKNPALITLSLFTAGCRLVRDWQNVRDESVEGPLLDNKMKNALARVRCVRICS